MKGFLSRLGNLSVIVISVVVFFGAFIGLTLFGQAQKPPTIEVLVAARDMAIGDVIDANSVSGKLVVKDENSDLYIPYSDAEKVYGSVVTLPFRKGQPIYNTAVLSSATGNRMAALLNAYPEGVLFPLPLDAANVYAPDPETFVPGDLVGITVVVTSRPQEKPTPMPENPYGAYYVPGVVPTAVVLQEPTPTPAKSEREKAMDRVWPPLSKDLFPEGVRVIAVQGLPDQPSADATGTTDSNAQAASVVSYQAPSPKLILLVPYDKVEALSLALQQGSVYVTLMAKPQNQTMGFSYWDLEELIRQDRDKLLPTSTPTPSSR